MPEPVLISIAAALASRSVVSLYNLVKAKFADDPAATLALETAEHATDDSPQVRRLAATLADAEATDPDFARNLRTEWEAVRSNQHAETGGVVNDVSGTVHGNVLQARDIQGNITL